MDGKYLLSMTLSELLILSFVLINLLSPFKLTERNLLKFLANWYDLNACWMTLAASPANFLPPYFFSSISTLASSRSCDNS